MPEQIGFVARGDQPLDHVPQLVVSKNRSDESPRLPTRQQVDSIMGRRGGEIRHTAMARELGVHPRTIRRLFNRGGLPGAKEHGERILLIPAHLFRLAQTYGLRGVERMAHAGMLGGGTPH